MRKGRIQDLEAVEKIYQEAKARMAAGGLDQWQGAYPSGLDFLKDLEEDQAYVWEDGGQVIAVAACVLGQEKNYEKIQGAWTLPGPYVTIHRLAIGDAGQGRGLANGIFQDIESYFAQKLLLVRIDTHRDNKAMQRILKKRNYHYAGVIQVADGTDRDGFEKELR
ncbi:acetyltransferase, GNAT family [Peptoniphilus sp. oral taxon 375 str. F0436]|nr:acetyltransferase, GNAT family [Peptoniphilus sp. oral taxon 375 str. F0436]